MLAFPSLNDCLPPYFKLRTGDKWFDHTVISTLSYNASWKVISKGSTGWMTCDKICDLCLTWCSSSVRQGNHVTGKDQPPTIDIIRHPFCSSAPPVGRHQRHRIRRTGGLDWPIDGCRPWSPQSRRLCGRCDVNPKWMSSEDNPQKNIHSFTHKVSGDSF